MKTLSLTTLFFVAAAALPASAVESCDKTSLCPALKATAAAVGTVQLDLGTARLSSLPATLAAPAPSAAKPQVAAPRAKPTRTSKPAMPAALFM